MEIDKIAQLIKTKRKEKGLTQEELATKLNVTEKAISRWETGRGLPDISILVSLSEELGLSVSEILKGVEDKKEDKNIKEIVDYIDISKKNKNKIVLIISSIIYFILIILYLTYLKKEYSHVDTRSFNYYGELIINAFFMISIYLNNRYIANNYYDTVEDKTRMNKISYIMFFLIYLIMLFNITIFGRNISSYGFNIIPFKTIMHYLVYPTKYNIIVNIIGNIIILMPIEYFIIKVLDIKKYYKSLIIDILIVILIEWMQYKNMVGVFDIDDVILNISGMSIMYLLVTGKHKLLTKYKRFIITSLISLLITFIIFHTLSWYTFGDMPTILVTYRLLFSYIIIELITYFIYKKIET